MDIFHYFLAFYGQENRENKINEKTVVGVRKGDCPSKKNDRIGCTYDYFQVTKPSSGHSNYNRSKRESDVL